jgi:hypothetical protein
MLLVPLTANSSAVSDEVRRGSGLITRPYLAVLGSPPLQEALEAPVMPRVVPVPVVAPTGTGMTERHPADDAGGKRDVVLAKVEAGAAAEPAPIRSSASQLDGTTGAGAPRSSKAILKDEFQAPVRPEDLLPFFVYPAVRRDGGGPAPIVPPPSSATYRQQ